MSDAEFNTGTRTQTLGDPKAGVNADLDALAAYVGSLTTFANSPNRNADGSLTAAAVAGRDVFRAANCAACHGGASFTNSATANLFDIGTIKPSSGGRLGGPLTGIDVPTLRDVWATAPYLHDGSAPTLSAAVVAHSGLSLSPTDLTNLVAYVEQIGAQETSAPRAAPSTPAGFAASAASGYPTLSWSASTDSIAVAGYIIYRSTNGTQGTEAARTDANKRQWVDPAFQEKVRYTYSMRAFDFAGNLSALTALKSVTASQPPTTPVLASGGLSGGKPKLVWTASTDNVGVDGYVIRRNSVVVARTTELQWVDTAAVAGTLYSYNVRAYDAAGNVSDRSDVVTTRSK